MSITITWQIDALDCVPDVDGMADYVVCAHWRCNGTDGTFSGSVYNTQSFEVKASDPNFVPYSELTEELVVSWVKQAIGAETVEATDQAVIDQIMNQIDPPTVTPPLPWAQPVNADANQP